ncbi:hypothetical protein D3C76_99440 [compost metagenome]
MSEMEKLAEKLKQQKLQNESTQVNSEELTQQWVSSLDDLVSDIESWLKPLVDANVLRIKRESIVIHENPHPELRTRYPAPVLTLTLNGSEVKIKTKGRYIFGCVGRVDIEAGVKTWIVTRHVEDGREHWIIRRQGDARDAVAFNSDSLAEALSDYL